jgi:predicted GNAT family N-acyltransferase
MQAIAVAPDTVATWTPAAPGITAPSLGYSDFAPSAPLRVRFFRTAKDRQAIAGLRELAAFGVEQDLGLGLQPFEQTRDEIGLVTAAYREDRPVATLRLVPTGQGLTGAERLLEKVRFDGSILEEGSWEIGRVIMQPEDRHPDLLLQCLRATLEAVMQREYVRDFHATTTLAMARLWRRVGMRTVLTTTGASGTKYCLVHGRVEDVAAALQVPHAGVDRAAHVAPELLAARQAAQAALRA